MMTKRIFLTILLAVFVLMGRAQLMTEATNPQGQLQVEVSEEVELMSILSRAAGRPEFSFDLAAQYSKDVESWLSEYRKHPTVAYYQDIIAKYGIGYERVTNMAIHIEIAKGKVIRQRDLFDALERDLEAGRCGLAPEARSKG